MSIFVKDRSFYKTLLAIALPIGLQNLITFAVSMADTVMLGALGDVALSASSLANQPTFIFSVLVFGIASGACVLSAQYWGKKDLDRIQLIFGMGIKAALAFSVLVTLLAFLFPEQIMRIFTNEEPVIAAGKEYLSVICFTYFFLGITSILTSMLKSIEIVRISVVVSCISVAVNVFFNWVFIFGNLGAPAMGVRGAAIATLIARITETAIVIVYMIFFEKKVNFQLKKMLPNDKDLWKDFFKYGLPGVINEFMWSLGTSMQSIVIGRLGSAAVSANSITGVVQQLATIFIFGVAHAAAVIIGKAIGEGDQPRAHAYAKTLQAFCVMMGVVGACIVLVTRGFSISMFNVSEEAKALAQQLLIINAILVFFVSYTAPTMVGILRGGGDIKFVMWLDILCLWAFTTPMGFLTGLVLKFPVWAVFAVMRLDEVIKSVIVFFRLRGTGWIRNVTRD